MSDMAFAPDGGGEISIHGSALEPHEPAAEFGTSGVENSDRTEPQPQTSDGRIAELENELERPYSPDFIEGFKAAAEQVGAEIEHEFGSPEWIEQAQAELGQLREQYEGTLQAMQAVVQLAEQEGNAELAEFARGLVGQVEGQRALAEFEMQARAEEAAIQEAETLATGLGNISQWITDTAEIVGADEGSVDPGRVAEIASDAYGRLVAQHGQEAANAMVPELIRRTVAHVSDEHEVGMQNAYQAAEKLSHAFAGRANPTEVVRIAGDVFPRALYKSGGDVTEASRQSLMAAAKTAAGFGEKSQPEKMNLAELYASLNDAVPRERAPEPKREVQLERVKGSNLERDPKTGRFTAKPVASFREPTQRVADKYAVRPQSPGDAVAEAQKAAIKQAFAALNNNR